MEATNMGSTSIRRTHPSPDEENRIREAILRLGSSSEWFELQGVMERLPEVLSDDRVPSDQWVRIWLRDSELVSEPPERTRPLKYRLTEAGRRRAEKLPPLQATNTQSGAVIDNPVSGSPAGFSEIVVQHVAGASVVLILTPDQFARLQPALALI